ncbi:ABC transporter permease [Sphaerotilus mobilis]|uniref:Peptide/nickel transport system permease protein n=1 Tax=Sphaerotilus mobilis TaxID=47994 RepID=A0A4Q7LH09_9BURK|nr:ABC transporter permease [Sphaerotilus mobilis]RZS53392.1 peptide/nickel transport system permease protein [Sphaerotilus mobilis]
MHRRAHSVGWRALRALLSVLGISAVLFAVLKMAPGDPMSELVTHPDVPPEVRRQLRHQFGLDQPPIARYFHWLWAMLRGDWGWSHVSRFDVIDLILQRLPVTLAIVGGSLLLALALAVPIGMKAGLHPGSAFDRCVSALAYLGYALPSFFTGLLLILLFSIQLGWLPFVFRTDLSQTGWPWMVEQARQSLMPVLVLASFQSAIWLRHVRSAVMDVACLDHVRLARSKGLPETLVVWRHVLPNALIPLVTLLALQLPAVFSGAIVTEQIFRVPGIGSLLVESVLRNDTPVLLAITLLLAVLVVMANALADVTYGWLDPRIGTR